MTGPADPADDVNERRVERPLLRVVKGSATAEEVAALVAVLASLGTTSARTSTGAAPRTPEWQAPRRRVRPTVFPGPGGWRASGLPGR